MKTREQIVDCIFKVLTGPLQCADADRFHSDARLREDLALDSSATLELLVHLELEFELSIPEESMMADDFETVRQIAQLLYDAQPRPSPSKLLEYEEDIKLHCFVSCLSEAIKRRQLDQRPLYFAVWDAEVTVNHRHVISYHSKDISHAFFVDWYERLFGIEVRSWYDHSASKDHNAQVLQSLVENRTEDQHIMVMLDMYQLPERVNEFSKDPFPHYLMLGPTQSPTQWMVYDPDYRWEGTTDRERILNAMRQPSVAGGYVFSDKAARAPHPRQIKAYYDACMRLDENPMTEAIRASVKAHLAGKDREGQPLPLSNLPSALQEIPILSIRKYAYEHGFAFFWRELDLPEEEFDYWCEVIDELAKTFKLVQFNALKLAATANPGFAEKIFTLLKQQDQRELQIKKRMQEVQQHWCDEVLAKCKPTAVRGTAS